MSISVFFSIYVITIFLNRKYVNWWIYFVVQLCDFISIDYFFIRIYEKARSNKILDDLVINEFIKIIIVLKNFKDIKNNKYYN